MGAHVKTVAAVLGFGLLGGTVAAVSVLAVLAALAVCGVLVVQTDAQLLVLLRPWALSGALCGGVLGLVYRATLVG